MVLRQVAAQQLALAHCELLALQTHELRPAEAERAVGVAGLTLRREKQRRLAVLVLHPGQRLAPVAGHVVFHLTRRMRIQRHPDLVRDHLQLARVLARVDRRRHLVEIGRGQHVLLREGQPEHPVVQRVVPVDQVVDHVTVRLERQHPTHDVDVVDHLVRQRLDLLQLLEVVQVDGLVALGAEVLRFQIHHVVLIANHASLLCIVPRRRDREQRVALFWSYSLWIHSIEPKQAMCSPQSNQNSRRLGRRLPVIPALPLTPVIPALRRGNLAARAANPAASRPHLRKHAGSDNMAR